MSLAHTQHPSDLKLKELILYITKRSQGDVYFGAVKLNKILFYCDFLAYLNLGHSITGHKYRKLERGPAPIHLVRIRSQMIAKRELAIQKTNVYGNEQHKPLALREPNTDLFGGQEIALVEQILQDCRTQSAAEISDLSHEFIGWKLAKLGETIPYFVALVGVREPSESEKAYGRKLVATAQKRLTHAPVEIQNSHPRSTV